MSTVFSICPRSGCGKLRDRRRCPPGCERQVADDRRRAEKQRAQGRNTQHWRRTAAARKAIDGYRCVYCDRHESELGEKERLTVHLDPSLGGNHYIATVDDCVTGCSSCHGRVDAPRARA